MFKMFKNESKTEKSEQKSSASIVRTTNMNSNGTCLTTSVTENKINHYTTASHATSTHVVQNSSSKIVGSGLTSRVNTNNFPDNRLAFKGAPPRSAFTSTPLTTKSSFPSKTSIDAKPFIPVPVIKTPPQISISNTNPQSSSSDLRIKLQVKVKKSSVFCDDQKSIVPVYKTRSKHRGKLLLINNIEFINSKDIRKGAELDELNICDLFKQMGFDIIKHRNLSQKGVMSRVTAFCNDKTLGKVDIGAVVIMSHGTGKERSDSTEIACTDGLLLPTTWIINQFDNTQCPHLVGKPKIFIFQCCRGEQWDIQHDGIPMMVPRKLADMLIAYATVPGFVAHRDPIHGTWYIQAICKVFMDHAHDKDVESLLKIVDSKLSSLITDHGSKQTSSFENRGFKTCYLHPQLHEK